LLLKTTNHLQKTLHFWQDKHHLFKKRPAEDAVALDDRPAILIMSFLRPTVKGSASGGWGAAPDPLSLGSD
jgi:hypothetical protein